MANWQDTLDKGVIHVLGGMQQNAPDFITLLKTAHSLELLNCLFL